MVDFVCECNLCGHKDYRFNVPQKMLDTLSAFSSKSLFRCYHCHEERSNMTVRQLKWKDIQKLHQKFPNKKALFTTLTVDELLKLNDDLSPEPTVK